MQAIARTSENLEKLIFDENLVFIFGTSREIVPKSKNVIDILVLVGFILEDNQLDPIHDFVAHMGFEPMTLTYEDSEIPSFSNALLSFEQEL